MKTMLLFVAFVAAAGSPAVAQVPAPAGADHPMAMLMSDVEDARKEAESIEIRSTYCKPPYPPAKADTQWEIDFVTQYIKLLIRQFERIRQGYLAASGTRMGSSYVASFPVINGVTADHPTYWPSARRLLSEVEGILRNRQERLNRAPERDCTPPAPQRPPDDPQAPRDPLAGLKRPQAAPVKPPALPPFFCSEADRTRALLDFDPMYLRAAENAEAAAAYRAEVSRRGTAHAAGGGDAAGQQRLDAEERWADGFSKQQQRMVEETEQIRQRIRRTPVVDCSRPEYGQVPGSGLRVTVTGGALLASNPDSGEPFALPVGVPFTAGNGRPSELVQSWAFGSGAALVNSFLAAEGRTERVIPLDALLATASTAQGAGADLGGTVSYSLTSQWSVWGEVRLGTSSTGLSDAARDQIRVTADSLQSAWTRVVAGASGAQVTTDTAFDGGGGQLTIGGGVEYCFMHQHFGGWHPTVRAGLAVAVPTGGDPAAALETRYRFNVGGSPFDETDRVLISIDRGTAVGAQFGGTLRRPLTDRMELVVDVMFVALPNRAEMLLTAEPSRTTASGGGAVAFVQTPTIQFSNSSLPSSLSQPVDAFATFRNSGLRLTTRVSGGISFGF